MNNEALQGIREIINPILPKFYIATAIICTITIILAILIIMLKRNIK